MSQSQVLILTAVQLEAQAVVRALGMVCPKPGMPARGMIGRLSMQLHLIGIGGADLGSIVTNETPACVVMAGVAGALDPDLEVGDVIVDKRSALPQTLKGIRRAAILTTNKIISTPAQKADLYRSSGAACVDMETALVRDWAAGRSIPFVAIRAISDSARQSLDPAILQLVDRFGRPRITAVAGVMIRKPWLIPRIVRLGADSKRAAAPLAAAVKQLVDEIALRMLDASDAASPRVPI